MRKQEVPFPMRLLKPALAAMLLLTPVYAQMFHLSKEEMIKYTAKNPFDRFPDGRPKVDDKILERVKGLSLEEAWGLLQRHGYKHQFAGKGFQVLHPGQKLVGRAVTAQYLPARPDLAEVLDADAKAAKMAKEPNQKVIDLLELNDVAVIDMMGAGPGHTFGGDNLHAAIYGRTKTGAVIDGMIRDLEGIAELPTQVYFKRADPSSVADVAVAGINIPVKIGEAIVMAGDVVLGDREGVIFIPPHLVKQIVDEADRTHIHDEWTKAKFLTGKYRASELYGGSGLTPELKAEYGAYMKKRLAEINK
jgi:4-hydroxy-4-methyl-2-oxoglutarate aldolase